MLFKRATLNVSPSLILGMVLLLCCLESTITLAKTITVITTTTTTDDVCAIPPADQVVTLIHNAIRITHGVPALAFSPALKTVAQTCADYHATQGTDLVTVPPEINCPTITGTTMAESYNYIEIPPLVSDSQLYRSVLWNWYLEPDPNWAAPAYDFASRHKVQMIWRTTTTFACARSSFTFPNPPVAGTPSRIYVSCIYSPPGNDQVTPNAFAQNVFRDSI